MPLPVELMALLEEVGATEEPSGEIHVPVSSSFIDSLDYRPATWSLTVNMTNGSYHYAGISPAEFAAFASAASPGDHYNENIKGRGKHHSVSSPWPSHPLARFLGRR
jgi:hypothetical protein